MFPRISFTIPGFKHIKNHTIHVLTLPGLKRSGPTVVLIHGLAATASSWMPLIKELSRRAAKFIIFDLPGHGLSPAVEPPFTFLDAYEIVKAVILRELEPDDKPIIVGNSLGGAFAMRFVLDYPKLVSRAILISPAGAPFPTSAKDVIAPFFVTTHQEAIDILHKIFVRPSLSSDILAPQLLMTARHPCFLTLLTSILQYDTDPESPVRKMILTKEELRQCPVPIQLIWGQKDKVLPQGMRDFYDAYLPDNCTRIFPETFGHCPQFEDTKALASLMNLD